MKVFLIAMILLASPCLAEKEKKTEHTGNKVIVKEREKGSGAEWKTVKEYTLMFKNNRKARKPKDK